MNYFNEEFCISFNFLNVLRALSDYRFLNSSILLRKKQSLKSSINKTNESKSTLNSLLYL